MSQYIWTKIGRGRKPQKQQLIPTYFWVNHLITRSVNRDCNNLVSELEVMRDLQSMLNLF